MPGGMLRLGDKGGVGSGAWVQPLGVWVSMLAFAKAGVCSEGRLPGLAPEGCMTQ